MSLLDLLVEKFLFIIRAGGKGHFDHDRGDLHILQQLEGRLAQSPVLFREDRFELSLNVPGKPHTLV